MAKITLIDVGRGKVNKTFEIDSDNETFVNSEAYREVRKHLMSSEVELYPQEENNDTYDVLVGWGRKVGEVKIEM